MQRKAGLAGPTARQWQDHGVDQSRITLIWSRVAPSPASIHKPDGFNARDNTEASYNWGEVDRAVAALNARGIEVTLALTSPAPVWATAVPSRREPTYKPDPQEFGDFAHAVAVRYAGKATSFILINEPNLWQWLTPQVSCSSAAVSSCKPASPAIYRRLFRAGYDQIKAVSPGVSIWGGALAPGGRANTDFKRISLGPLTFLRSMGCVTASYKRDRSSSRGCSGFSPLKMDGIAVHPHTAGRPPTDPAKDPDSVTIPTIGRMTGVVDRIQAAGGVLNGAVSSSSAGSAHLGVYIDEYGVQTDPPDQLLGVSLSRQNSYYQQAAEMMWKNPRVKLLAFYLWQDEPIDASSFGAGSWQSGVYFASGKAKPSAESFDHPFWVDLAAGSKRALLWGQVRPGGAATVTIEAKPSGSSKYSRLAVRQTNAAGYFSLTTRVTKQTSFRFTYGSPTRVSSVRTVKP